MKGEDGRLEGVRDSLIQWFSVNQRDLPWRRRRDPYAVWLSEVMLQQTQVATVVPYFERFLAQFPTVHDLAAADLDQVLSLWSGLGYYARARNLHRAAIQMSQEGIPTTSAALRKLPGLGPYTSAAIATFAFGEAVPVLDGNVARVLCRLDALELPDDQNLPELKALSEVFLDRSRPGPFNEAMMELGALVCTPTSPDCSRCPVRSFCRAFECGAQNRLPLPRARLEKKSLRLACAVLRDEDGRIWLVRREKKGLFNGLWEIPWRQVDAGQTPQSVLQEMGFAAETDVALGVVKRTLTHRVLTMELWPVRQVAKGGMKISDAEAHVAGRWVSEEDWPQLGLSTAMKKALETVLRENPCVRL